MPLNIQMLYSCRSHCPLGSRWVATIKNEYYACLWPYAHVFCCCCNFCISHFTRPEATEQFVESINSMLKYVSLVNWCICRCAGFYLSCMRSRFVVRSNILSADQIVGGVSTCRIHIWHHIETCSVFLLKRVWAWAATSVRWLVRKLHEPSILTRCCCVPYIYVVNVLFVDRPKCRYY